MPTQTLDNKSINNYADSAFGILLIVMFLVCIVILFLKGIFSSDDILEKGLSSLLSTSGASGSAVLYMKWKVIRSVEVKKVKMSEVTTMLKNNDKKDEDE